MIQAILAIEFSATEYSYLERRIMNPRSGNTCLSKDSAIVHAILMLEKLNACHPMVMTIKSVCEFL